MNLIFWKIFWETAYQDIFMLESRTHCSLFHGELMQNRRSHCRKRVVVFWSSLIFSVIMCTYDLIAKNSSSYWDFICLFTKCVILSYLWISQNYNVKDRTKKFPQSLLLVSVIHIQGTFLKDSIWDNRGPHLCITCVNCIMPYHWCKKQFFSLDWDLWLQTIYK